jgi:hypothetical protein
MCKPFGVSFVVCVWKRNETRFTEPGSDRERANPIPRQLKDA